MTRSLKDILSSVSLDRTDIPSQVTVSERKVLKYLGSEIGVTPNRVAVDLGAGCGSSTRAIAEGLLRAPGGLGHEIHAYDWFEVGPGHYATQKFKAISTKDTPSFLEDFNYFLADFIGQITVKSGDIKKETWAGGAIDILHVDICTDMDVFRHIAREFFPHLRAGSIMVHQDFSRPRLPWLHISTGMMKHLLEPMYRVGGSVFFRVKEDISEDLVRDLTREWGYDECRILTSRGVEHARLADGLECGHFCCLAEFADIYVDFWFKDRALAKQRYESSLFNSDFRLHYPDLQGEMLKGQPI